MLQPVKIALGLFHFNPHWGGQHRSGHRHCTEALSPFLQALRRHPQWRTTIEISGSGLEFLDHNYPEQLRCLRFLVERGQVELLSALYTPTLWVAFPRHDLVKSIERNQRCLKELGLPWNRVFFAQEAFFGEAVNTLAEYFDVAICKDDYVSYFYDFDYSNPCLQIGDIKVVVASGHILYEALCEARRSPECTANARLTERHRLHIQEACELNDGRNFPAIFGTWRNLEWLWYHCGDGNHFSAIFKPQDLERAYHDRSWERWCEHLMDNT